NEIGDDLFRRWRGVCCRRGDRKHQKGNESSSAAFYDYPLCIRSAINEWLIRASSCQLHNRYDRDAMSFNQTGRLRATQQADYTASSPPPDSLQESRTCPFASCPKASSTASPPARWSSAPRAWSRSSSRTRSTPARRASTCSPMAAGGG